MQAKKCFTKLKTLNRRWIDVGDDFKSLRLKSTCHSIIGKVVAYTAKQQSKGNNLITRGKIDSSRGFNSRSELNNLREKDIV